MDKKEQDILKNIINQKKGEFERIAVDKLSINEKKDLFKVTEQYISFLDKARTTHETVKTVKEWAEKNGFTRNGKKGKTYLINQDESAIALISPGKKPVEEGVSILGAHADFCSLHLKDHPLKEDTYLGVRLDSRPYGGLWYHHYFDTDLRIICRIIKSKKTYSFEFDGVIFDPTIHINSEIIDKTVKEAFKGEMLDIITGIRTKKEFLAYISKLAGTTIDEADFSRADIYAVPKFQTMKLPGDELIVGYGHDDRSSVYAIYEAMFRANPSFSTIAFTFDREEIGSTGLTGALGPFFEEVIDHAIPGKTESELRTILRRSVMISADVDIALNFRNIDLSDADNSAKSGRGIVVCRVNGGKNQGGGNKAPSYLMDFFIDLWTSTGVVYQISSIPSKIEQGGGGTISRYFAERGVPSIDAGAPISGMHGKRSIMHNGDLYQCIKGFKAFMERKNRP